MDKPWNWAKYRAVSASGKYSDNSPLPTISQTGISSSLRSIQGETNSSFNGWTTVGPGTTCVADAINFKSSNFKTFAKPWAVSFTERSPEKSAKSDGEGASGYRMNILRYLSSFETRQILKKYCTYEICWRRKIRTTGIIGTITGSIIASPLSLSDRLISITRTANHVSQDFNDLWELHKNLTAVNYAKKSQMRLITPMQKKIAKRSRDRIKWTEKVSKKFLLLNPQRNEHLSLEKDEIKMMLKIKMPQSNDAHLRKDRYRGGVSTQKSDRKSRWGGATHERLRKLIRCCETAKKNKLALIEYEEILQMMLKDKGRCKELKKRCTLKNQNFRLLPNVQFKEISLFYQYRHK